MINLFLYIFILLVGGLIVAIFLLNKRIKEHCRKIERLKNERNEIEKIARGLDEYNRLRNEQKESAKSKIIEFLKINKKIANKDVENLLNVSDETAFRYCEELEKEGKIKQIGKTGKSAHYQLN